MNRLGYIMEPYRMVYGIICNGIWYMMIYNRVWQTLLPVFVNKGFYLDLLIYLREREKWVGGRERRREIISNRLPVENGV